MPVPSLKQLLRKKQNHFEKNKFTEQIKKLQLDMLRIQQGVWHRKDRVVILIEGFDAAGKGGVIRMLTEKLDPRGVKVHPIGVPSTEDQGKHWLYRFWTRVPAPGEIAIFDRTWYGRVLVEKVDKLISNERINQAYKEIVQFEEMLKNDGITVIKFFLGVSKDEQLKRFQDRLNDPYKHWKLNLSDIKARKEWKKYVEATDVAFNKTHTKKNPWHLIPSDSKSFARISVLEIVTRELHVCKSWIEDEALKHQMKSLKEAYKELESKK